MNNDQHERDIAIREAEGIGAEDAYFEARPLIDSDANRDLFRKGFLLGFRRFRDLSADANS